MDVKNLKKQISEYRKWLRLGQVAVAEYLGISKSAMSALESEDSKRNIELDELLKLCKLFMCKPNDLMEDKVESHEMDAIFNTRKNNFDKDIDARDRVEVNFFSYELKKMRREKKLPEGKQRSTKNSITDAVEELLETMKVTSAPVDVYAIASHLGIFVKFSALTNLSGALIHSSNENGPGILLNSNQPEARLRFSLAHEIAHYFLNHYPNEQESVSVIKDSSPIEKDADMFASLLLMPRKLLTKEIQKIKSDIDEIEVFKLSDKFSVSFQAMLVTLRNAGFISQAKYDQYFKCRVSELKERIENFSTSKFDFNPDKIQEILDQYKFDLSQLDRDQIRLIQEIAFQEYMKEFSVDQRATPVKDVYEKVVIWLVNEREKILSKNFIESVAKTLTSNNISLIDKTHNGGCLWVVSSPESDAVVEILRKKNVGFKFAPKGGKATKNKPAWYLSSKNENSED